MNVLVLQSFLSLYFVNLALYPVILACTIVLMIVFHV